MIIEGSHWEIDDNDLVIGMMVHGVETVEWIIPLLDLSDAIDAAKRRRGKGAVKELLDSMTPSCDCHLHENQACDICQGVVTESAEKPRSTP
jgi:hypothetical protein